MRTIRTRIQEKQEKQEEQEEQGEQEEREVKEEEQKVNHQKMIIIFLHTQPFKRLLKLQIIFYSTVKCLNQF